MYAWQRGPCNISSYLFSPPLFLLLVSCSISKRDNDDVGVNFSCWESHVSSHFAVVTFLWSRHWKPTCVKMRSGPTMKWNIMNFWYCEFCLGIIMLFFHILVCISVRGVTKMVFICLLMMILRDLLQESYTCTTVAASPSCPFGTLSLAPPALWYFFYHFYF